MYLMKKCLVTEMINNNKLFIIMSLLTASRLPRTICFGRGSSKGFVRNHAKSSKKNAKSKTGHQKQHTSQEVTINYYY